MNQKELSELLLLNRELEIGKVRVQDYIDNEISITIWPDDFYVYKMGMHGSHKFDGFCELDEVLSHLVFPVEII